MPKGEAQAEEPEDEEVDDSPAVDDAPADVQAAPEDDRAAIRRMIEERRKARTPARPMFSVEDDDLFTDLDQELNSLQQTFFAADGDDLEFITTGGGEDGASMHRFKYLSPGLKNVRSLP